MCFEGRFCNNEVLFIGWKVILHQITSSAGGERNTRNFKSISNEKAPLSKVTNFKSAENPWNFINFCEKNASVEILNFLVNTKALFPKHIQLLGQCVLCGMWCYYIIVRGLNNAILYTWSQKRLPRREYDTKTAQKPKFSSKCEKSTFSYPVLRGAFSLRWLYMCWGTLFTQYFCSRECFPCYMRCKYEVLEKAPWYLSKNALIISCFSKKWCFLQVKGAFSKTRWYIHTWNS